MFQSQIHSAILAYLAGLYSFTDFEDWFLASTWAFSDETSGRVRLLLAEHERSDISEDGFKGALLEFLDEESRTGVFEDTANVAIMVEPALEAVA